MNSTAFVYPLMTPLESFRPFGEMSGSEAERHFKWFVSSQSERITVLRCAVQATTSEGKLLGEGRPSLRPLWIWAKSHVQATSPQHGTSPWLETAGVSNRQLTPGTMNLAVDIGFHLTEILQRDHPAVRWQLWTRSRDYYFQRPVLVGLGRHPIVPHDPVVASFWRIVKGTAADDELTKILDAWVKKMAT